MNYKIFMLKYNDSEKEWLLQLNITVTEKMLHLPGKY